jgi:putative membrane protein
MKLCTIMIPLTAAVMATSPGIARVNHASAFLAEAAQGDNSEITLGQIAARKGQGAGVRNFGTKLVADHTKAKRQVAEIARHQGIRLPAGIAPEASAERLKLNRLSGRQFDREFARYMVDDHEKDIAKFTAEANSRDNRDVTALARQTLSTLRQHLAVARTLTRG